MVSGISLANKCQLLFGFSVVVIIAAALFVPWFQTGRLVREFQREVARQSADAWLKGQIQLGTFGLGWPGPMTVVDDEDDSVRMELIFVDEIDRPADEDTFFATALRRFTEDASLSEHDAVEQTDNRTTYIYARAIRESEMQQLQDRRLAEFSPRAFDPDVSNRLRAILIIRRSAVFAAGQQLQTQIFIIASGLGASLLAILVFYFILTKLILSPVRNLRETAEKVKAGDLSIRAEIQTGDEFEQLSEAFNSMLGRVAQTQTQLRSINESLDLKLNELAEANVGLYESNRLKGEFLANVSHELRTPLNSIIGFAELLNDLAKGDPQADPKRSRYLSNILTSARALLDMINDLLDMAKIEAGRIELTIEPTVISDLVEGLQAVMRPQAEPRRIEIQTRLGRNLPPVETDPGKLQQILYNFLSNAIKFSPERGTVTITAERITRQDQSHGVRLGVSDQGPGIPDDMQDMIFEKFRQIDASHTRSHQGVGLGLAICRELAELLGAQLSLVSEPGSGATFYVELPVSFQSQKPQPLMA